MQRVEDNEEIIERVAAIDIGKSELVACVRVPDPGRRGRRQQEIIHSSTLTPRLLVLADRLCELGVTRGVMEATSDYWKPVFYLLESRGLDPWLVNARDVKHLPGRPKTDRLDAGVGRLRPRDEPRAGVPLERRRQVVLVRHRRD
jgi:transposase